MAVDQALDVTPPFTISTTQFNNETLNVIITSLLVVLILANIGSAISKLVYFTRETSFNYESWLRAFIFANSDDPLRLIQWARKRYVYRDMGWTRRPQVFRKRRMVVPLLARLVVLVCSIASVAITIPNEKKLEGCTGRGYKIRLDDSDAEYKEGPEGVCTTIPLKSSRGTVRSTASFCECTSAGRLQNDGDDDEEDSYVYASHNKEDGALVIEVLLSNGTAHPFESRVFYAEWRRADDDFTVFRTNISASLSPRETTDVLLRGLLTTGSCTATDEVSKVGTDGIQQLVKCDPGLNVTEEMPKLVGYLRSSLKWEEKGEQADWIQVNPNGNLSRSTECPITVTISRPIVNMVPLAIALVIWFGINVIVSHVVRNHGNALDAGFHIIKEILGHDTTSNPLEEAKDRKEITEIELRNWRCSGGGGHVGFIGRHGDVPVPSFDKSIVVGECSRAALELARARAIHQLPIPPSANSQTMDVPYGSQPWVYNVVSGDGSSSSGAFAGNGTVDSWKNNQQV